MYRLNNEEVRRKSESVSGLQYFPFGTKTTILYTKSPPPRDLFPNNRQLHRAHQQGYSMTIKDVSRKALPLDIIADFLSKQRFLRIAQKAHSARFDHPLTPGQGHGSTILQRKSPPRSINYHQVHSLYENRFQDTTRQDPEPRGLQLPDTRVAPEIVHDWLELATCALIPALFIARSSRDIQLELEAKSTIELKVRRLVRV
ncbi:hypothetical protein RRG08_008709 [Elysia crispata]|uniref:Uncharacterized protein n=1 Tax=Elysia crispata TaxID=231223 RepID=A0AAE1CKI5_9GAST|nr:hypothetical protein RRG08_008709 [Elysia crispata]